MFAARGDFFLLTNAGGVRLLPLASTFVAGERVVGTPTSVRESPAEAVDAGIVFDRDVGWDCEPTHLMPEWESEELEATLSAVGVAVD